MDKIGCKLIKYYEEPSDNYNIVSVTYFYMKTAYAAFDEYYDGMLKHINIINNMDNTWYLRIYFSFIELDDTSNSKKFIDLIEMCKTDKKVQLIEYIFDDNRMDNIIGMMMRLYPLFDFKDNNKIDIVLVRDIDIKSDNHGKILHAIGQMNKDNVKVLFRYYMHNNYYNPRFRLFSDFFTSKYFITNSIIVFNNYKCSKIIFNNFLKSIIGTKKNKYYKLFNRLKTIEVKSNKKYFIQYGTDELFTEFMLKKIISDKILFATLTTMSEYIVDDYFNYFCKHNKCDPQDIKKIYENIDNTKKLSVNLPNIRQNIIKYKNDLLYIFDGFLKYIIKYDMLYDKYFIMDKDLI